MDQIKDISNHIFLSLKEGILNLDYTPGMPITEKDVCDQFKASRTPVHTALLRLADIGCIELMPYQKSRVKLIELDAVKEMIYVRTTIEDRLIRDFIALDNPLLLEDVEHLIRKQEIIIAQPDFKPSDFYKLDAEMHGLWYKTIGMTKIREYISNSTDYTRVRMMDIKLIKEYGAIVEDHKTLLGYMKNRETEKIYPLMEKHFMSGLNRMKDHIDTDFKGYFA